MMSLAQERQKAEIPTMEGEIELYYVPSGDQTADALTKAATRAVLEKCRSGMGVEAFAETQRITAGAA